MIAPATYGTPPAPRLPELTDYNTWRRVDPRTLAIVALPIIGGSALFLLLANSQSSIERVGVLVQALLPLLGILAAATRFITGKYAIVDGALHWKVGLLVRNATQIGIERIQDVEITRPLLARILGLAELKVSSAGGAGEIKLMYLDHGDAARLGHHLQALIGDERMPGTDAARPTGNHWAPSPGPLVSGPAAAWREPARLLHTVSHTELASWALFRLWPVTALVVAIVVMFVLGVPAEWFAITPTLPFILLGGAKTIADRVGLSVSIDQTSLFTQQGLTTVRRTSTQRERVQLVVGYRLFLQGQFGAESVRFASADVTGNSKEGSVREELGLSVPIGTWHQLASVIAGRQVMGTDSQRAKPAATAAITRWRWAARGSVLGLLVAAILAPTVGFAVAVVAFVAIAVVLAVAGLVRASLRVRRERWGVSPQDLLVTTGIVRRKTLLLFAEKTQAIEVRASLLQRRWGLCTVVVDIAPPGSFTAVVISDIPLADAGEIVDSLERSARVVLPNGV